nr:MAG TPA: hypothetical protein [Caudoviricetes sp.]
MASVNAEIARSNKATARYHKNYWGRGNRVCKSLLRIETP